MLMKNKKLKMYLSLPITGRDIEALLGCDGIVLCYDWFQSKGCRAECSVAEVFKKKILTDNTVYEENQL